METRKREGWLLWLFSIFEHTTINFMDKDFVLITRHQTEHSMRANVANQRRIEIIVIMNGNIQECGSELSY